MGKGTRTFGEYVKSLRVEMGKTLREFCEDNELDPSADESARGDFGAVGRIQKIPRCVREIEPQGRRSDAQIGSAIKLVARPTRKALAVE